MPVFTTWSKLWKSLGLRERTMFLLHLGYAVCDGASLGIIALNEFVLLRNMGAGKVQVSLFFQLAVFVMPFSIILTQLLSRVQNRKKLLRKVAFFSRLPLFLFLFFPDIIRGQAHQQIYIYLFLLIFLLYYIANPFVWPLLNLFTKKGYAAGRFGQLFSYALMLTQIVQLLTTYAFGILLDARPEMYKYAYAFMGFMAVTGVLLVSFMPFKEKKLKPGRSIEPLKSFKNIIADAVLLLKENRAFGTFQTGMMAYGFGFLMSLTVITLFLSRHFNLSYSDIAFYKNIPILLAVVLYPVMGRYMDARDPRKLAGWSYFFHMLFYIGLLLAYAWPAELSFGGHRLIFLLLVAYLFQGIFSASMGLVWGIGSAYFAPAGEEHRYHALHITLTGLRGILAPLMGVAIFEIGGFYGAFGTCIAFQLLAIRTMRRSLKKYPLANAPGIAPV